MALNEPCDRTGCLICNREIDTAGRYAEITFWPHKEHIFMCPKCWDTMLRDARRGNLWRDLDRILDEPEAIM